LQFFIENFDVFSERGLRCFKGNLFVLWGFSSRKFFNNSKND